MILVIILMLIYYLVTTNKIDMIKARQKAEYLVWYFMDPDRIEGSFDRQYNARKNNNLNKL